VADFTVDNESSLDSLIESTKSVIDKVRNGKKNNPA